MHLGFVPHTYKNCHSSAPKFPWKGLAMLTILPQLLGCGGEKTPMNYWTKSHQSTPKPHSIGMATPSSAVPQQFGKHKPTPGSDLWGEAANIHLKSPSQSMPLPICNYNKRVAWPQSGETGDARSGPIPLSIFVALMATQNGLD